MFFHVLKMAACLVEALQLGCIERIERALVLVVHGVTCRLIRLGRSCPNLNAQLHVRA